MSPTVWCIALKPTSISMVSRVCRTVLRKAVDGNSFAQRTARLRNRRYPVVPALLRYSGASNPATASYTATGKLPHGLRGIRPDFCCIRAANYNENVSFDDYKLVIYRNRPDGWVAEIPAIAGCHALMPTAEEAVTELAHVFALIAEEHRATGQVLPRDSTEIVHA